MSALTELFQLREHIRMFRFNYANELELQRGIEQILASSMFHVEREVQIGEFGRLDFLVNGRTVIETKIGGSSSQLMRQVSRYAECSKVEAILVISDRANHRLPESFNGKPVLVHSLIGGALWGLTGSCDTRKIIS